MCLAGILFFPIDIFNESMVSEFEQNPNGSQYPLSKFEFFQNGTISKIYLPKYMDKYNKSPYFVMLIIGFVIGFILISIAIIII